MLSPAHTEQVIDVVLEAYGDVFAVVADAAVRGDEQDVWRVPRCRY